MNDYSHGDRTLEHILAESAEREAANREAMDVALQTKAHMVNTTTGNYDVALKALGCTQERYDHEIHGWVTVWVDANGKDVQFIGDFAIVPEKIKKTTQEEIKKAPVETVISDEMTSAVDAPKALGLDFALWFARIKNAMNDNSISGVIKAQNYLQQPKAPLSAISAWVKSQE